MTTLTSTDCADVACRALRQAEADLEAAWGYYRSKRSLLFWTKAFLRQNVRCAVADVRDKRELRHAALMAHYDAAYPGWRERAVLVEQREAA